MAFIINVLILITYYCHHVSARDEELSMTQRSFKIDYEHNCFLKDGKPFRYIAGGFHYFRVPRANWDDSLKKAKACGLNAIQTYIAWNIHEPKPGVFDFEGEEDLIHFIKLCQANGLLVILRPGPYIDAEWDYGGFPWWLTNYAKEFRTSHDLKYMHYVERWLRKLLGRLKALLYKHSGPIISVQVENEYGNYYACDHRYMIQLKSIFEKVLGDDVVYFTTDGHGWTCGSLPSLYTTIDFGVETDPVKGFKIMRKYQPRGPLVNSEFYTGWQDFWGYPHSRVDSAKLANRLDEMLAMNASVTLYMFQGGTNFGFMNGNDFYNGEGFVMAPTTYDYNAPLSEAGDPTEKYHALRNVIQKYTKGPLLPVPKASVKMAYGKVNMETSLSLDQFIKARYPNEAPYFAAEPKTMEELGIPYGFMVYRTRSFTKPGALLRLQIDHVSDRTLVFVDGRKQIVAKRGSIDLPMQNGGEINILVENQGRLCYGSRGLKYYPDPKGIIGSVMINSEKVVNWEMFPINDTLFSDSMNRPTLFMKRNVIEHSKDGSLDTHMFFEASFTVHHVADTFIDMNGWSKGQVWINSFNIGRYWQLEKGPQRTLFVPSTALHVGENRVQIFELDASTCNDENPEKCSVEFLDKPILI